jgi:hypothetical protein
MKENFWATELMERVFSTQKKPELLTRVNLKTTCRKERVKKPTQMVLSIMDNLLVRNHNLALFLILLGDKKHGIGSFTFTDGGKYTGRFVQDNISGQGKYQYPDGRSYEGEWKNNKKHGVGVYHLDNGIVYKGVFINGKRNGKGKLTW